MVGGPFDGVPVNTRVCDTFFRKQGHEENFDMYRVRRQGQKIHGNFNKTRPRFVKSRFSE